jgi:IS30 family transposase
LQVDFTLRGEARKTSKKYKHMSIDDRIEIQKYLNKGMTFEAIGNRLLSETFKDTVY